MPGEDALVDRLRGLVKGFGALPGQRLTNALLRSELQRHVGGVAHLPTEFRRKRADQQHFITGQPKREVLLAAWEAFTTVPEGGANKFDPDSVYADWALQGANRGRPAASAAAASADVDSVHESANGAPAHMGQTSMEPWMQGVWVNLVDLKLARWKRLNAPSVLGMLRHQRTVVGAHLSASDQFRDDVAQPAQQGEIARPARRRRSAGDSEVLRSRVEQIMDDGWLGQAGLQRLPRVDETGHLVAYTDAARKFVARVSGFLHAHPREWAELWHNVRAKKRRRAQEECDSDDEQIQSAWESYWRDRLQNAEGDV